ncbi:hypothetical protein ACJJTC_008300 [Scirpophaga incertulas]
MESLKEFDNFRRFVAEALSAIEQQVAAISRSTDALEMRSRRGILLLHGVREQKAENLCELSLSLFSNHLGGLKISADQICKSFEIACGMLRLVSRVQVSPSPSSLQKQRHRVFIAAREQFGISNCWTKSGRIVIMDYDGKRHTIESVGDIEKIKACSPRVSPEASGSDKPTTYVVGNKKKRAPSAKRNK